MIVSAALGALLTVVTGGQPGALIGVFLIGGTLVAGLVVAPGTAHVVIPLPALGYLAAALVAGIATSPSSDMSKTALAIHLLQWIARGFLTMVIATALAIAIAVLRRRVVSRQPGLRAR